MGNVNMEARQIHFRGGNKPMSVEEAIKASSKADNDVIAPEFDSEAGVYAIGDLVMHEGKLYEFTTAHETAGDWDSTEVTEKTVADEIGSVKRGLTNYENQNNLNLEVPNRKNVLPITLALLKTSNNEGTWNGNEYTYRGITFTCAFNTDGYITSVTANGTATDTSALRFYRRTINPIHLDGSFIVSGGYNEHAAVVFGRTYNGNWQELGKSTGGDSAIFTCSSSDDQGVSIDVDSGTVLDNVVFYPMVRPSYVTDSTFAPYIPSVESRIEAVESATDKLKVETVTTSSNTTFTVTLTDAKQSVMIFSANNGNPFIGLLTATSTPCIGLPSTGSITATVSGLVVTVATSDWSGDITLISSKDFMIG